MPTFNIKCKNETCELCNKVTEVVVIGISTPMPPCDECGEITHKTFEPTEKDKAFFASRTKRRTQVKDPFRKPNTVPRRAFDKGLTGADLADDLRTGDIFE